MAGEGQLGGALAYEKSGAPAPGFSTANHHHQRKASIDLLRSQNLEANVFL